MFLTNDEIDELAKGNGYPGTVEGCRKFAERVILMYRDKLEKSPIGWIQTDHLAHSIHAPALCRVSPFDMGLGFTPIYAYPF